MAETTTTEVRIKAPPEKIWDVLAHSDGVFRWASTIVQSRSATEANRGVGSGMTRKHPTRVVLKERVVAEDARGILYVYDLNRDGTKGLRLMKSASLGWAVTPVDDESLVTVTFDFRVKFEPLGSLFGGLLRGKVCREMALSLAGLKHHAETGEPVGSELPERARQRLSQVSDCQGVGATA